MTSDDAAEAYERNATRFLAARDHSAVGSKVVANWARTLPHGATTIELGCGGGYPVSQTLIDAGLKLHAIDGSATLCDVFQQRFPDVPVQCTRVQDCRLFDHQYDAAIAIGLMFLLPVPDQEDLIRRVAQILGPAGRFLFTAPLETGSWIDLNTGIQCVSAGRAHYESILQAVGFNRMTTFEDAGANNYYDVQLCDRRLHYTALHRI